LNTASTRHRQFLRIANRRKNLFEIKALIEGIAIEKTREGHGGNNAEDHDYHDQLDDCKTALFSHGQPFCSNR